MSDWNYINDRQPHQSGTYLCVARVESKNLTRINHVFLNEWDNDKKAFSYDITRKQKGFKSDDERIYAWLAYKQPPNPMPNVK